MTDPVLTPALEKIARKVGSSAFKALIKKAGEQWEVINTGFDRYYKSALTNHCYTKTIVDPENRVFLKNLYVQQKFSNSKRQTFDEYDILEKLTAGEKIILTGHGGSGKTFFVKNAFLDLCESANGLFPIFFELRSMNKSRDGLKKKLAELLFENNQKLFSTFGKQGRFIFILDGFDELDDNLRESVSDQILRLVDAFPDCGVLLTSRYSRKLSGWNNFLSFYVKDFDRKQTLELLEKVDYVEEQKESFIEKIDVAFFKRHQTFLSSPLLALMMLITFGSTDQLPTKLSEYYDLSFRAIFYRHDSMKRFTRKRELGFSEFQLFFSYFCLISYCAKEILLEFDEKQLHATIKKAAKLAGVKVDEEILAKEMMESTCLLQKDGLRYVFIHRSYQEYFCALGLINNVTNLDKKKRLYQFLSTRHSDSVVQLAFEINSQDVEKFYIVPTYDNLKSTFSRFGGKDMISYYCEPITDEFKFESASLPNYNFLKFACAVNFLYLDQDTYKRGLFNPGYAFQFLEGGASFNSRPKLRRHLKKSYPNLPAIKGDKSRLKIVVKGNGKARLVCEGYTTKFSNDVKLQKILIENEGKWKDDFAAKISAIKLKLKDIQRKMKFTDNTWDDLV